MRGGERNQMKEKMKKDDVKRKLALDTHYMKEIMKKRFSEVSTLIFSNSNNNFGNNLIITSVQSQ